MLTSVSAKKRENAHFCFTSCSFFVEPRGKVVHVSGHTLDAVRKCICTVKLRTRQKATLKNASFQAPLRVQCCTCRLMSSHELRR